MWVTKFKIAGHLCKKFDKMGLKLVVHGEKTLKTLKNHCGPLVANFSAE